MAELSSKKNPTTSPCELIPSASVMVAPGTSIWMNFGSAESGFSSAANAIDEAARMERASVTVLSFICFKIRRPLDQEASKNCTVRGGDWRFQEQVISAFDPLLPLYRRTSRPIRIGADPRLTPDCRARVILKVGDRRWNIGDGRWEIVGPRLAGMVVLVGCDHAG